MAAVVADTGPLHYLVLIEQIGILPILFDKVFVPDAVYNELRNNRTPDTVRQRADQPPSWLTVMPTPSADDASLRSLDEGERAAIALANSLGITVILMDDRAAVRLADSKGLAVVGTTGLLDRAAQRGLLALDDAFSRLKATNFRHRPELLYLILAQRRQTGSNRRG
jgi:predicted nucleic acid-binding protein